MTHVQTSEPVSHLPPFVPRLGRAVTDRLHGPGGYYNIGNLLGLSVAVGTQLVMGMTGNATTLGTRLYGYFSGSPSALALTIATTVFLVSGEAYHRAWAGRTTPSPRLNRIADLLAAAGATALTVSLVYGGQTLLALASGILMVGGKIGSAVTGDDLSRVPGWPATWSDPFRTAVLVGRLPGLVAAALDLGRHLLDAPTGVGLLSLVPPATLVLCQALWLKADLLLLASATPPAPAGSAVHARTTF